MIDKEIVFFKLKSKLSAPQTILFKFKLYVEGRCPAGS